MQFRYIVILQILIYIAGYYVTMPWSIHLIEPIPINNIDTVSPDSLLDVVKITRSWTLPAPLKKISGFDFIDQTHIACVQDEAGTIFIFNLESGKIDGEIPFAPPGDYEAMAIVSDDAFVACADGRLFEIDGYRSNKPVVKEHGTNLTVKQNVEGLCYDSKNKRLLVAIKGSEEENQFYKGIYAFDLTTRTMPVKPVLKIDLQDSLLNRSHSKKLQSLIQPSDLDIHPNTHDIYITDAIKSQLIIMDESGTIKGLFIFRRVDMIQPEGIRFTPSGELYIASEGYKEEPGKLLLVEVSP